MSQGSRRPAPSPERRRASRPSLRSQLLVLAGILVLAGGAFYTALVVTTQAYPIFFPGSSLDIGIRAPGIKDPEAIDAAGRRWTFLVMGVDRRAYEGNAPSRTDTMFVMTIDPQTRSARALAIPRDLWVDVYGPNGVFQQRVNSAYEFGEAIEEGSGIETVMTTVESFLGIDIDHYAIIDFDGFKEIISLLGGVEVEVPEGLGVYDPTYSETELLGDFYPCIFEPGTYQMDGSQALCYARVRNNSDDRERILRQQTVIDAVVKKATQLNILESSGTMLELWRRYRETVQTDVNDLQAPGFAKLAASIDRNSITYLSLGGITTEWTTPEGAQVLLASPEGIKLLVDAFTSDNQLQQEAAVIEVQNGSGLAGAEQQAVDLFTSLGVDPERLLGLETSLAVNETQIIDFTGKAFTAQRISGWLDLPAGRIRTATPEDAALRTQAGSDIVVILGADAELDTAEAP
ncbi:MAG TPA: LCP family protein [Dehalococcoidia bacterium]|nr:LCP family protein [Dehalococcoidia bacterium]